MGSRGFGYWSSSNRNTLYASRDVFVIRRKEEQEEKLEDSTGSYINRPDRASHGSETGRARPVVIQIDHDFCSSSLHLSYEPLRPGKKTAGVRSKLQECCKMLLGRLLRACMNCLVPLEEYEPMRSVWTLSLSRLTGAVKGVGSECLCVVMERIRLTDALIALLSLVGGLGFTWCGICKGLVGHQGGPINQICKVISHPLSTATRPA